MLSSICFYSGVTAAPASRGSRDFKLVAANNHRQVFHKIMERNGNSIGAIGVVGPMINKNSANG